MEEAWLERAEGGELFDLAAWLADSHNHGGIAWPKDRIAISLGPLGGREHGHRLFAWLKQEDPDQLTVTLARGQSRLTPVPPGGRLPYLHQGSERPLRRIFLFIFCSSNPELLPIFLEPYRELVCCEKKRNCGCSPVDYGLSDALRLALILS